MPTTAGDQRHDAHQPDGRHGQRHDDPEQAEPARPPACGEKKNWYSHIDIGMGSLVATAPGSRDRE